MQFKLVGHEIEAEMESMIGMYGYLRCHIPGPYASDRLDIVLLLLNGLNFPNQLTLGASRCQTQSRPETALPNCMSARKLDSGSNLRFRWYVLS